MGGREVRNCDSELSNLLGQFSKKTSFCVLLEWISLIRLLEVGWSTIKVGSTYLVAAKGCGWNEFCFGQLPFTQAGISPTCWLSAHSCHNPRTTSFQHRAKTTHALGTVRPFVATGTAEAQSPRAWATHYCVLVFLVWAATAGKPIAYNEKQSNDSSLLIHIRFIGSASHKTLLL